MAKKAKAGSRKKNGSVSKGKRGGGPKSRGDEQNAAQLQQNPYDRVNFVRPLWETLSEEERVKLLTVKLEDVQAKACEHAERAKNEDKKGASPDTVHQAVVLDGSVQEILDEGLKRLKEQGTWKVWRWDGKGKPYIDAEAFRREAEAEHIAEDLQQLLPREEGKPVEKPAEAALRDRMTNLLSQIHVQLQNAQDAWRRGQRNNNDQVETVVRDGNIDLVIAILEALQQEHHCLYQTILTPVTDFVCSQLPTKNRKSSRSELFFEDLEKLPPDEIARLYEWLTEKVDSLCAKLKPDAKEEEVEEEETVGDIDLFSLTPDGESLTVNPKWLHHLQERRLSEEGQPRKVKEGEDECRVGLVLEWVYGSIVSTAEKARDGAKRSLGSWEPSITQAHENLCAALKDQRDWEVRSKKAKELLKAMLETRKTLSSTMEKSEYIIPGTPAAREPNADTSKLPDDLIVMVLKREELLTQAKLHVLQYDRMMGDSQLRNLRAELMQVGATNGEDAKQIKGEPEFERLRRELDDVKNTPRGLEGTFRTAAEKERHRAQLADSLLEEQLEVQSAFREQGARLQGIYDKRQRTEIEMAKREQEITQLRNWQRNVNQLMSKFTALDVCAAGDVEEGGQKAEPSADHSDSSAKNRTDDSALEALRATFHRDFKKQLYSDIDDTTFFNRIKKELKNMDKRLEDGAVVLQHLEMFLINVACNDPGAAIGSLLVLPLLQERLDKEAMEFATHRASLAEEEILRMEENEKQEADTQKKISKAKKLKEKLKKEKERKQAEQKAKEAAEQAEAEEHQRKELERIEEERRERQAQLEQQRKDEEALIEHRRQELLSEEHGYWRMRMEADSPIKDIEADSKEKTSTPQDDEFTSVGGHRRRIHERRSSWGGNRNAAHDGIGRRGSAGQGDNHHRRHNNQEPARRGNPHRRNKSEGEALLNRSGSGGGKETGLSSTRQSQKAAHHSGPRQQKGTSENSKPAVGSRNVWNHPDKRSHKAGNGRGSGQKAPLRSSQSVVAPVQPCTPAQIHTEEENSPKAEVVRDSQPIETSSNPSQKQVASKKIAWVKGSIPASVIGKPLEGLSSGYATSKESDSKQSKSSESRPGSVATDVSVNSPVTPDGEEADTPSIHSDSDKSQQICTKKPGAALAHIKTTAVQGDGQKWHSRDAAVHPNSHAESKVDPVRFDGNGEQFFQMVQSVSAVEEEEKEVSEAGSNADDADDESQPSGFESGQDSSPTAPVLIGQPMHPPFGMPMGGPMGPMTGYHPGSMPWMRPVGGMGPSMRPMYPFMAPPPNFIHPPSMSGPSPTPSVASSSAQVSSPAGPPSASEPVRPPGGPMYFYPPHVMPHGPPVMQPFMPMMHGPWMGYPMGPHHPPFMGPGRVTPKKFALRPTAKEFIPPSMMNEGGSGAESDAEEDSMALLREEADARDSTKAVTPAIQQEV